MLIKDPITELCPLLDQKLGGAGVKGDCVVPVGEEGLRQGQVLPSLPAPPGVLGVGQGAGGARVLGHQDVRVLGEGCY